MTDKNQSRVAFENTATAVGWGYDFRIEDGEYFSSATAAAYKIWQAREPELAALREEMELWRARCIAAENGHPQFKQMQEELTRLKAERPLQYYTHPMFMPKAERVELSKDSVVVADAAENSALFDLQSLMVMRGNDSAFIALTLGRGDDFVMKHWKTIHRILSAQQSKPTGEPS